MTNEMLLGLLAGMTIALLVGGLFRRNRQSLLRDRIERLGGSTPADEYEGSFYERVVRPTVHSFGGRAAGVMPTRVRGEVRDRLREAGIAVGAGRFLTMWVVVGAALPVSLLLTMALGGVPLSSLALMFGPWLVLGAYGPWVLLRRRAKRRTAVLDRGLPDAIDLIVTLIESGLGLQAAMMRVADHLPGPVAVEFTQAAREVSIGRTRAEALTAMAERNNSRELKLFVRAIVQAEQMGISVGAVLRNQAREVRERRQQLAREQANTIPVKMTIPTVLLIFPTLFLLILGPMVMNIMEVFGG